VSYPLIVDGRVFVTAKDERNTHTSLYALNADTGTLLWQSATIGSRTFSMDVNLAYDRGKVFVSSFHGDLVAFDAASGDVLWKIQLPNFYGFTTPPLAAGGAVFISGAADSRHPVLAISGNTGRVLYDVASIGGRPLTLGESVLYDGAGCSETVALDAPTGKQLWHFETGCSGGGSSPTVYHRGQLFVPDSATPIVVLDAATGAERRFRLNGFWAPACEGDNGFLVVSQELSAVDLRDSRRLWKLALGTSSSLESAPIMPPVVVNGFVYVVDRKGALSAVAAATGHLVWKDQMATDEPGWVDGGGGPLKGIGAGEERLVAPYERTLHAYF
jgi:outer membrane protein assembly factor BamB